MPTPLRRVVFCLSRGERYTQWFRGVVVERADLSYTGCEFESCARFNKSSIGKEGMEKPPHIIHLLENS